MRLKTKKWLHGLGVLGLTVWLVLAPFVPVVFAEESTSAEESPAASTEPSPSPEPTMITETGDAGTIAESGAEVNNTLVGESSIETSTTLVTEESEDVTPFVSAQPSLTVSEGVASTPAAEITELTISNEEVEVVTEASAAATTGENTQIVEGEGSSASMETGSAVAVATATTIVNSTLIDSSIQIGTVSVLTPWDGDIVLDPPLSDEGEESEMFAGVPLSLTINNEGQVVTVATAEASTGNNTQSAGGSAEMTTGSAMALSSSTSIVNASLIGVDILAVLPENIWLWEGKIRNWEYPGSVTDPRELFGITSTSNDECGSGCVSEIEVENSATVVTSATAVASTGDNTQISSGSAEMKTGIAAAGATATAIVNSTLINSRLRILHLLLFASWTGDLVFAYPDLVTTVSAPASVAEGEDIPYTITLTNRGYAAARGVQIAHRIVNDEHLVVEAQESLTDLKPGESIVKTVSFDTTGRGGHLVRLTAEATEYNVEESTTNNVAEVTTLVVSDGGTVETKSESNSAGGEKPILELSARNNINDFVYPGDGVIYDLNVTNVGGITAHDAVLVQTFYAPDGSPISEIEGKVGEIAVSKGKGIRFVLTPSTSLKPGAYYTESYVVAESDQGVETKSNIVRNEVKLIARSVGQTLGIMVEAQEPDEQMGGSVLGAETPRKCQNCLAFPWYLALTGGTLAYYLINAGRREFWRVLKWGLILPLSAYAGLLWTNPDCRQGLTMIASAGTSCRWFLPIAYVIYLGLMVGVNWAKNRNRTR